MVVGIRFRLDAWALGSGPRSSRGNRGLQRRNSNRKRMRQSLRWNMLLRLGMRDRSGGVRRDGSGGMKDRGLVWRGCGLWGRGIPGEMGDAKRGEFLLPALQISRLVDETRREAEDRERATKRRIGQAEAAENARRRTGQSRGYKNASKAADSLRPRLAWGPRCLRLPLNLQQPHQNTTPTHS